MHSYVISKSSNPTGNSIVGESNTLNKIIRELKKGDMLKVELGGGVNKPTLQKLINEADKSCTFVTIHNAPHFFEPPKFWTVQPVDNSKYNYTR